MDRPEPFTLAGGAGVLLTDLYELTMLEAYHARGMNETAVFELFVRALPPERNFLVAAGLEQALDYLEALRFGDDELQWLAGTRRFSAGFLESLRGLRFTGDVDAMPEGTVFFAGEPIVRITAPLREAQLVESRLMNLVHFQTLVASKAARVALAAPGKLLVDFGMRRAHGAEAALLSARAAWLAGFGGTATVEAARRFGIRCHGTMAHSFVLAHDGEAEAFEAFALARRGEAQLLIDTYDTEAAARIVARIAPGLAARGAPVRGVRIDSGDLAEHARRVRAIFDAAGLSHVRIFASGNLDEHRIAALEAAGAPIDGYGVGTRMNTSADAPSLDCAYKLQEYAGVARRKRSEGKATWPGRKQVFRTYDARGRIAADRLALAQDAAPGAPLLVPFMRGGMTLEPRVTLADARAHAGRELARLPRALRSLAHAAPFAPTVSDSIVRLAAGVDARQPKDTPTPCSSTS